MSRPSAQATRASTGRPSMPVHSGTGPLRGQRAVSGVQGPAGAGPSGLGRPRDAAQGLAGAGPGAGGKINAPRGFGSDERKCPHLSQESSTSKKQTSRNTLLSIIQRCEFYGTAENYERMFGTIA